MTETALKTPGADGEQALSEPTPGPVMQSVAIAFLAIYAATLILALVWLVSNIRQIAPDSQAVVLRFGRVVRTQESGLLLAWPRPIEDIRLLPGPGRQLNQVVTPLSLVSGDAAVAAPANIDPNASSDPNADTASVDGSIPPGATPYLTGDGNVVLLDATMIYRITDPRAYVLAETHIAPALDRLFRATAVRITAGRGLNEFLVSQSDTATQSYDEAAAAQRAAMLDALLKGLNARLQQLSDDGAGLGIEVARIDLTDWLPPEAKPAFDAVLTASQEADQKIATARTDAELRRQGAEQERDRLLSGATAKANETIAEAHSNTATIDGIEAEETPTTHDMLMLQAYRAEAADILNRSGGVTLIDPGNANHLILTGRHP